MSEKMLYFYLLRIPLMILCMYSSDISDDCQKGGFESLVYNVIYSYCKRRKFGVTLVW